MRRQRASNQLSNEQTGPGAPRHISTKSGEWGTLERLVEKQAPITPVALQCRAFRGRPRLSVLRGLPQAGLSG